MFRIIVKSIMLLLLVAFILAGCAAHTNSSTPETTEVVTYEQTTDAISLPEETVDNTETAASHHTTSAGTPINEDFDWGQVSMQNTPESSCFSKIGYGSNNEILVVTFRDKGTSYAYYEVPQSIWEKLCQAESKGSYYNNEIKGYYYCEKIE